MVRGVGYLKQSNLKSRLISKVSKPKKIDFFMHYLEVLRSYYRALYTLCLILDSNIINILYDN